MLIFVVYLMKNVIFYMYSTGRNQSVKYFFSYPVHQFEKSDFEKNAFKLFGYKK